MPKIIQVKGSFPTLEFTCIPTESSLLLFGGGEEITALYPFKEGRALDQVLKVQ